MKFHDPSCAKMQTQFIARDRGAFTNHPPACTCGGVKTAKKPRLYIREASSCPGRAPGTWVHRSAR